MDEEQTDALKETKQNTGVDVGQYHYIGDMSNPFMDPKHLQVPNNPFNLSDINILPGGGLLPSNTEMDVEALKKENQVMKAQINEMQEMIAMMNEKLNKYLKYERRSIGPVPSDAGE